MSTSKRLGIRAGGNAKERTREVKKDLERL
jgi:hypothetical protein